MTCQEDHLEQSRRERDDRILSFGKESFVGGSTIEIVDQIMVRWRNILSDAEGLLT